MEVAEGIAASRLAAARSAPLEAVAS
jgi:hypothetical protein